MGDFDGEEEEDYDDDYDDEEADDEDIGSEVTVTANESSRRKMFFKRI